MRIQVIVSILLILTTIGCKKDSAGLFGESTSVSSFENSENLNTENIISVMKKPKDISLEELAKIIGVDAKKIQVNKDYSAIKPSERRLLFSWPNGEVESFTDLEGEEFEVESYSSMGLTGIRRMTEEEFKQRFESEKYNRLQIEKLAEEGKVNADILMAEAENLAEIEKDQKFEKIEGIGESAYWETPVNALHVYADGTSFTVTSNLTDKTKIKQKTLEFLNLILSN